MQLTFDPPFLPMHAALLALVLAAVATTAYARGTLRVRTPGRLALAGLRVALLLLLAFILLNPVRVIDGTHATRKTPFVLLVDTSRSMCTDDTPAGSRYAQARLLTISNRKLLADLAKRYDLRVFEFSDKPAAAAAETLAGLVRPNGDRTNLGMAISQPVSSIGANARGGGQMLVISDGRDNSDSFPIEAARAVKAEGFAIHTLCVGRETQEHDLAVVARKPQVFAAPDQPVQVAAEIRDSGISRRTVRVDLQRDGKTVSSQNVLIQPGRREVAFPVQLAKKGVYRYAVNVVPDPEEQNPVNNRANVFVNVTNTQARVLFLEGRPSWDSKFLAKALRSDPTVSLDVIYKLTDAKFFAVVGGSEKEQGVVLPRTVDEFSRYDVIVFGKGFEEFYDADGAKALKQWIAERGGNVLFLRGRADERTDALREIEPVIWSDAEIEELRMRLTDEGKAHPGFALSVSEDAQTVVRKMPSLVSATRVQGEKALAVVLARAEDSTTDQDVKQMATLAYQRYGQGKVMAIVGQGLWRWAFLPPDLQEYQRVYDEFWTQTVRWMVSDSDFLPGQNLSIRADRQGYAPGEQVNFLGYLRGKSAQQPATIQLTLPDGTVHEVGTAKGDRKRADFTATYRPPLPGEYIASLPTPGGRGAAIACVFTVYPGHEEDMNRSADPDLMRQIAAVGGGSSLTADDIGSLSDRLRAVELARRPKTLPQTAWDRWWVLVLLFGLAGGEWWLRRKSGLV